MSAVARAPSPVEDWRSRTLQAFPHFLFRFFVSNLEKVPLVFCFETLINIVNVVKNHLMIVADGVLVQVLFYHDL